MERYIIKIRETYEYEFFAEDDVKALQKIRNEHGQSDKYQTLELLKLKSYGYYETKDKAKIIDLEQLERKSGLICIGKNCYVTACEFHNIRI